jgi:hypothetical protein
MANRLIGVEFENYGDGPLEGGFVVLADRLTAFLALSDTTRLRVAKVWFSRTDPQRPHSTLEREFWSFGKCWWSANTGRISRIGAGAYGDDTVWQSPAPADHKYVWR